MTPEQTLAVYNDTMVECPLIEGETAIEGLFSRAYALTLKTLKGKMKQIDNKESISKLYDNENILLWREIIKDSKTCMSKIENLIQTINQLPVCYNQTMLRGSLGYCLFALEKLQKENRVEQTVVSECCDYVSRVERIYNEQHKDIGSFMRLDLQQIEDNFTSTVERECEKTGLLPKLDDFTF